MQHGENDPGTARAAPLDGRERLRRLHHAAARVYRVTLLALPPSTLADHSSNRPVRELWNTIRLPSAHHEGVSSIYVPVRMPTLVARPLAISTTQMSDSFFSGCSRS